MKKIKVTKQEAWLLGNIYGRKFSEENIAPENKEIFLRIKKGYE